MSKGLFDRLDGELEARDQQLGLKMSELLTLPSDLSRLLQWVIRQGQVSLAEMITFLEQDETATHHLLADLLSRGYVREIELRGTTFYRVRLAPKRGSTISANLWQVLDDRCKDEEGRS